MRKHLQLANTRRLSNRFKAQVIERRPGHPDEGKIVRETDLTPNLILDQGMNNLVTMPIVDLFLYCAIGSGTTPTEDDSGAVTATTSGTTVTSSGAFFTIGDIGKLLRFDTGEKAKILTFVDGTHVTVDSSLGVASPTLFTMYRVAQTGLTTEVKRTNNYLTGAGNTDTVRSGSTLTHQRTYDFPVEVSDQSYNEVGFSNSATVASNLNTRGIFAGAPVAVVTGQQLRVIYYFVVTLSPTSPVDREWAISGWPSLEHPVAVDSGTDRISLTAHGLTAGTKIFFDGTTPPSPLVFGTDYYVVNTTADDFQVEATIGGGAIDLTTTGTAVILYTNTEGQEQLGMVGLSRVVQATGLSVPGFETISGTFSNANEPFATPHFGVSDSTAALPTWPTVAELNTITGGKKISVAATYVNGSFTRTWSVTFATTEANSSLIRRIWVGTSRSSNVMSDGLIYRFDHDQEKTSLFTLTLTLRKSWDRDFV